MPSTTTHGERNEKKTTDEYSPCYTCIHRVSGRGSHCACSNHHARTDLRPGNNSLFPVFFDPSCVEACTGYSITQEDRDVLEHMRMQRRMRAFEA